MSCFVFLVAVVVRCYWTAKETALGCTAVRLSFAFLVDGVTVMAGGLGRIYAGALRFGRVDAVTAAAFGVFAGLEVADFYVFLGCHNISFAVSGYWFVLCKTHRTTIDARQRHSP